MPHEVLDSANIAVFAGSPRRSKIAGGCRAVDIAYRITGGITTETLVTSRIIRLSNATA